MKALIAFFSCISKWFL